MIPMTPIVILLFDAVTENLFLDCRQIEYGKALQTCVFWLCHGII